MSTIRKPEAGPLVRRGTDREFRCPECGRQCTVGLSGVEYGHARGNGGRQDRCSRRPAICDPQKFDPNQ